jgi:MoaA/NifB/PqqE/SkfB family radical SAM enzyme
MSVLIGKNFAIKNLQSKICLSPFNTIHIGVGGEVHICPCPGWQTFSVGNIYNQTLEEILTGSAAVSVRQSIIDGSYQYCNENQCALIINDQLNTRVNTPPEILFQLEDSKRFQLPTTIAFNIDKICNLSCPSCRTSVIKNSTEQAEKQQAIADKIFNNVLGTKSDRSIEFTTSGAGEVFASPTILGVLNRIKLENFPNLKLNLHTNGLLAPSKWALIEHLASAIKVVTVSIDAASAETYQQVRRGGHWPDLLSAMQFLQNKKRSLKFDLRSRMIVQQRNYKEAIQFYNFSRSFDVDRIEFSRLTNWRTWTTAEFFQHDVLSSNHLERSHAAAIVNEIKKLPQVWFEGNFD